MSMTRFTKKQQKAQRKVVEKHKKDVLAFLSLQSGYRVEGENVYKIRIHKEPVFDGDRLVEKGVRSETRVRLDTALREILGDRVLARMEEQAAEQAQLLGKQFKREKAHGAGNVPEVPSSGESPSQLLSS